MISIDPGVHFCGVAYWGENNALITAKYVKVSDLRWTLDTLNGPLVIEMPRVYPKSKVDPNDLMDLAVSVGLCIAFADGYFPARRVYPADWKGQVPKKVMTARILSCLTPTERERIEQIGAKTHNTIDAVGIGLFHLGRL